MLVPGVAEIRPYPKIHSSHATSAKIKYDHKVMKAYAQQPLSVRDIKLNVKSGVLQTSRAHAHAFGRK